MQPRSGKCLVSSTLRGVLVPGCRDDNWIGLAAMARLGVCLYGVGSGCLQISSRRLAHGTGTVSAYVACVKNGVWWEEEETGSNVRALPDDGSRRRSRHEARTRDLSTSGAASLSATPTAWRALVLYLSLCTSHQFSKPSPEKIRLEQWRRRNCRRELVMGMTWACFCCSSPSRAFCIYRDLLATQNGYLLTVLIGFF